MIENPKASSKPIFILKGHTKNAPYREPVANNVEGEIEERKPNPFYVSLLLNG